MSSSPRTARQVAFRVIEQWRETGRFASPLLDSCFERQPDLAAADRRLASELTYGVIRRRATLGAVIRPQLKRPRQQVEPQLWTLLELGAYQLLFLSAASQHAAIHETVELTRWLNRPRWTGFANGVLRSLQRDLTGETATAPAADAVPLADGFIRLARPLLPDPSEDPSEYVAQAGSLPGWLVRRWSRRIGFEELLRMAAWFNSPAATWLRINPLRATADQVTDGLTASGIESTIEAAGCQVRLAGTAHVPSLPGFTEGWFTVQDPSAMAAAGLLDPRPGQSILDLCAAPGTKSTHLAELMKNEGSIVAADSHPGRIERIDESARRLGLAIIDPVLVDSTGDDLPAGPFDGALVDAPCSNTGVLGKRPEARWRIEQDEPRRLADLQLRLLVQAADRLKPSGRLVYSTCSIEPVENEELIARFLGQRPRFTVCEVVDHVPGHPGDGGFQALLTRQDQ
ncbi:MAG: 16S rRNA (cytosine(967)-C(5))-methyltransferase RsmB [Planctomycetaceae bacterium]